MIKHAIICAGIMAALTAQAKDSDWMPVGEDNSGARLVINTASFNRTPDNKNKKNSPMYVSAVFKLFGGKDAGEPFALVTDEENCETMSGRLFMRVYKAPSWETVETYFWSDKGTKLYDFGAVALCRILEVHKSMNTPKKKDIDL